MRQLKAQYPHLIVVGCAAHSFDLVLKDFGKVQKKDGSCGPCPKLASVLQQAVMASNVINGSASIRFALARKQEEEGKALARADTSTKAQRGFMLQFVLGNHVMLQFVACLECREEGEGGGCALPYSLCNNLLHFQGPAGH